MLSQTIYYQQERKYATDRFVVLAVLMLAAFVISGVGKGVVAENALLSGFTLLIVVLFSIAHFYYISTYPSKMVEVRKTLLLVADIGLLTFFIALFDKDSLYLLPLYLLIIIRSGLSFGSLFFNISVFLSAVAWFVLYTYSEYWKSHYEILIMFGLTTMLVVIFFQRFILSLDRENMMLTETLNEVAIDASSDELTGIANRKEYKETMMELIHENEPFALLFIDLNKFKAINDTHGHHVGDEVLKEVARRLVENCDEDDFVARLGGDEFAIITKRKKIYMEKFIAKLERNVIGRHKIGSIIVPIELSVGIAYFPDDTKTAMMLGKYADEAMYAAKKDAERYHYFYNELSAEQKAQNLQAKK